MTKKLKILGGEPALSEPLYVGSPIVEEGTRRRFFQHMTSAFDRNYLTNDGPLVRELEAQLAKRHDVRHCACVCNATIAEILLLKALELKGEVILPSFTFIATAHACLWQNLTPVFCDILPDTLMIDPDSVERLITEKTCAVIGVHLFGNLCEAERLEELCRKHKIKLIFDAAHAFNCSLGDRPVGGFGEAEFMSFHATKFFGTFEGGAVLTDNSNLHERIRYKRNFGFRGYDDVGFLGLNGKMAEASAAMGLASLPEIESRTENCRSHYLAYKDILSAVPGVDMLPVGEKGRSNFQYVVTFINEEDFGVSRDVLYRVLWQENVVARRYFYPGCHDMDFYKTQFPDAAWDLPVTEDVCRRVLCLPSSLKNPEYIPVITEILMEVHRNAGKVKSWASA